MPKNTTYVAVVFFLVNVLLPISAHALTINEIMYDVSGTDTGREWIEVFNGGTQAVDLSKYKLFENNVNHEIVSIDSYNNPQTTLPVGEYAIVADNALKFLEDWPGYTGYLFDSVFSLSNTGESLKLIDSGGVSVDTREYGPELGAKGDGSSLQFLEGAFVGSPATPGAVNVWKEIPATTSSNTSSSATTTNTSAISTHASQIDLISAVEKITIKVSAGRDRLTTIHTPIMFSGATFDNVTMAKVSFLWNFGDGTTGKGRLVKHAYKHPGIYNVVLNAISGKERAVSRAQVVVVEPLIVLESSTTSISVHNRNNIELNIGDFILRGLNGEYVFPKDTIINAQTSVSFDEALFPKLGTSTVELLYPNEKSVQLI